MLQNDFKLTHKWDNDEMNVLKEYDSYVTSLRHVMSHDHQMAEFGEKWPPYP